MQLYFFNKKINFVIIIRKLILIVIARTVNVKILGHYRSRVLESFDAVLTKNTTPDIILISPRCA